jgi:hypothetical protein
VSGPHSTSPERLRQIAEDLRSEGWYTIAGTISQVADEISTCCPTCRAMFRSPQGECPTGDYEQTGDSSLGNSGESPAHSSD